MSRRKILTKTCRRCKVEYHPTHRFQTHCGPACRWADERERSVIRRTRSCERCGKVIQPRLARTRHCSTGCGVAASHARKREPRKRACAQCGDLFIPYPSATLRSAAKFCSRPCYYASVAARPAMLDTTCTNCGTAFRRTRAAIARLKNPFCSRDCAWSWNSGPNAAQWRGGEAHWRGRTWTVALREEIRERDGRRCRMCGKAETDNGPRRLDVDHVTPFRWFDGDYEQANDRANLVALCTVCHRRKARAETKFLQGDVLEMDRYRAAVALPWPEAPMS